MHTYSTSHNLGQAGEHSAQQWCSQHHLQVLETNYVAPQTRTEIDIIAQDTTTAEIVFLEVKTRSKSHHGWPEEAVHFRKQQKIRQAAIQWLADIRENDPQFGYPELRFDVLALIGSVQEGFVAKHYRGVF